MGDAVFHYNYVEAEYVPFLWFKLYMSLKNCISYRTPLTIIATLQQDLHVRKLI